MVLITRPPDSAVDRGGAPARWPMHTKCRVRDRARISSDNRNKNADARTRTDWTCRRRGQECPASKQPETEFCVAGRGAILHKCREDKAFCSSRGGALAN